MGLLITLNNIIIKPFGNVKVDVQEIFSIKIKY